MRTLVDTQILIWEVLEPERLSSAAAAAIDREVAAQEPLGVSAFSLVEVAYAVEKASNPLSGADREAILRFLDEPECPFEIVPLTGPVAAHVAEVPRTSNADPGDRIIVATAETLGLELISADRKVPDMTTRRVIW